MAPRPKRKSTSRARRPARGIDFTWKMGGEAGTGIKNSALILAKAFVRGGYYVHANVEYPSIVRGGNNTLEVRMATAPIASLTGQVNLLACLDLRTLELWQSELQTGAVVLIDADSADVTAREAALTKRGARVLHVPIRALLRAAHLPPIMANTVMLGAITGAICYARELLEVGLAEVFAPKGKTIVLANIKAARAGYRYLTEHYQHVYECFPHTPPPRRLLLEGNEAVMLGALKAGLSFYAGYPMTPTSALLHQSAALAKKYHLVAYQPEDEIAAAQMVLGASYAGARAMTATSGAGFALMTETLGLAAMTETPFVILLGQRPGPATGLPTRTGQGDLRFALHAGQDEPPRIVLAPGSPREAFEMAFHAFNLAEMYQLVVIILADKYLLESFWTEAPLQHASLKVQRGALLSTAQVAKRKNYQRFAFTPSGVSPRVLPGTQGLASIWRVSADEHDPDGFITEERDNRVAMVDKRRRKMTTAYREYITRHLRPVEVVGPARARRAVVTFGSNRGAVLDALPSATRAVFVRCLAPFPEKEVVRALKGVREVAVIEGNDTGVFEGLLREHGIRTHRHLRSYDGRPLTEPVVGSFLGRKPKHP